MLGGRTMPIDNIEEAQDLTKQLKKNLPFQARPGKEIIKMMLEKGKSFTSETLLTIDGVMYFDDYGGITCALKPDADDKERVVVSITHLVIDPKHPLAPAVNAYQKKRVRALKLQDAGSFAELLSQRSVLARKKRKSGFGNS